MHPRPMVRALVTLVLGPMALMALAAPGANAAPVTLQNDTYTGGSANLAVQGGFAAGESFAAILKPTVYPFEVQKVQVLIAPGPGGSSTTDTYQLTITQDTSGSKTPGTSLYDQPVQIQSSTTAITELDVSSDNVVITSGDIRVRIQQNHKATPSIVRDNGPRKAKANLIYGDIGLGKNWYWLDDLDALGLKIAGNWIIRVVGDKASATKDAGVADKGLKPDQKPASDSKVSPDLGGKLDSGGKKDVASPDKGGSSDGTKKDMGLGLGAEGQACYPNGTCNPGLTCLSKLCVAAPASDDGCAVITGSGSIFSMFIGLISLLVLFVLGHRRRG